MPWWGWVLIAGAAAVPACGILSAVSIFGVRKYIVNAKVAEARAMVPKLAEGIAHCASDVTAQGTPRGLPPSSRSVPSDPSLVAGKKYQSALSDWSDDAFVCAKFTMGGPQYFVYQWRATDPTRGSVLAQADFDADGTPDKEFELSVECQASSPCSVGQVVER